MARCSLNDRSLLLFPKINKNLLKLKSPFRFSRGKDINPDNAVANAAAAHPIAAAIFIYIHFFFVSVFYGHTQTKLLAHDHKNNFSNYSSS